MPDIGPARPVSGSPIATVWGTAVHDAVEGIQGGVATVTVTSASTADLAVAFPRAHARPPLVLVTVTTTTTAWYAAAVGITATGFSARVTQQDGTTGSASIQVHWVAIGPLATPG